MKIIIEALRKDAAAGVLGYIDHADSRMARYIFTENSALAVIDLLLDITTAGVPLAFEQDSLPTREMMLTEQYEEWFNSTMQHGLLQSIIINERHINTVQVLKELGLSNN